MRIDLRPLRAVFAAILLLPGAAGGADTAIPRPAALERDVQFWIRIYTQVTTNEGFLHDENNLAVVYETLRFAPNTSARDRETAVDAARERYAAALRRIAAAATATPSTPPDAATRSTPPAAAAPGSPSTPAPAGSPTVTAAPAAATAAPTAASAAPAAATAPAASAAEPVPAAPASTPAGQGTGTTAAAEGLSPDDRRIRDLWGREGTPERLLQATRTMRFQLGQADRFRAGLVRAGAWEGHIQDTLANLGLPPEIAALPHVESSFDPAAYSKVGAAGLWQFMRSTGRRYLRIDSAVDERLDPFRSTEAAAQLLAYNYRILGSWPLAITAYNHGAAGMRRARESMGTEDIALIVRNYKGPTFGFASRNFYVSFLAALTVEQNPERYFGPIERVPEQRFREVRCPAYVSAGALERALKVDRETLRALNPALQPPVWEGQRLVPRGYVLRLPQAAGDWTGVKLAARLGTGEQYAGQIESRSHRVKRGESLQQVAARYGLSPDLVANLNHLSPDASLRPGRTLRLPDRHPALVAAAAAAPGGGAGAGADAVTPTGASSEAGSEGAAGGAAQYVVRRGESLSDIAARSGVSQASLMRLNGLRDANFIFEGQKLRLVAEAATAHDPEPAVATAAAVAGDPVVADRVGSPEPVNPSGAPADASAPQVTDAVDYSVARDGSVRVAAAETLGHYADWLGVGASKIRALNRLSAGRPLLLGQHVRLVFDRVTREEFERRRRDYHVRLQSEFFDTHRITGTEIYIARRGDSLWLVTQRFPRLPAWLLQQYNPDTDLGELRPGTQLVVPRVEDSGTPN